MTVDDLVCGQDTRRAAVRDGGTLNGIDYVEVLPSQRTLLVHCYLPVTDPPLSSALTAANVAITGGSRITEVGCLWAFPASAVPAGYLEPDEQAIVAGLSSRTRPSDPTRVLVVRTDSAGDFSTYTLSLIRSPSEPDVPAPGFDLLLASTSLYFKVDCPSDFDCATADSCEASVAPAPQLDYLAKDYASFVGLMLDRLAVVTPQWSERNPADVGVALVELLAYAADRLSYYQDAAATEAYLGTARLRTSVRRHARLLDYRVSDGVSARAWICLEVTPDGPADGALIARGTPVLSRQSRGGATIAPGAVAAAAALGATVFETLHDLTLRASGNEIPVYAWGREACCLPAGATAATLLGASADLQLRAGDVLVLEERQTDPEGQAIDADPAHRAAVRLASDPVERTDPLNGTKVVEVQWYVQDALPGALCVEYVDSAGGRTFTIARANVALADHGQTLPAVELPQVPETGVFHPALPDPGITQAQGYVDGTARSQAAATATAVDAQSVLPAVLLYAGGETWTPVPDLLASDAFAAEFVVETEDDGTAYLRFGDDVLGRQPAAGTLFTAAYRVGTGAAGNVGPESLTVLATELGGIEVVRNPLAAQGGGDPEPTGQVQLYAPQAFRGQLRAVTDGDYAAVAELHPEVQKAAVTRRWTRSWTTVFVTVDRLGGLPVDEDFISEVETYLDSYRLAGYDVAVNGPTWVALDLALTVCVGPGYLAPDVEAALVQAFSPRGGFFAPDHFTFGQPVYLSPIIATAMAVSGVQWVQATRFQRWGENSRGELEAGQAAMGPLEIARLDNDPNFPEHGRLSLDMEGGS